MLLLFCLVGLLLVGLSIPLVRRKIGPNNFYGLRIPDTLENEQVWYEANARSGREFCWLGVCIIVVAIGLYFVPWSEPDWYPLVCCGLLLIGVVVYSVRGFRIARQVKEEIAASNGSGGGTTKS